MRRLNKSMDSATFLENWLDEGNYGGLFIPGQTQLNVGTKVSLQVRIEDLGWELQGDAVVVWRRIRSARKVPGTGMGFKSSVFAKFRKELLKADSEPVARTDQAAVETTPEDTIPNVRYYGEGLQGEPEAEAPAKQAEAPAELAEAPAEQAEAPVEQAEAPVEQAEDEAFDFHETSQVNLLAPDKGSLIGADFRCLDTIAAGSMGTVYAATQMSSGRIAAVKVFNFSLESEWCEWLVREAKITSHLKHPNIVEVLGFGVDPRFGPYLAMELLKGETLDNLLEREGQLSVPRAYPIVAQLCDALDFAHSRGVVHCDLKPENIYLIGDYQRPIVKVIDFGVSSVIRSARWTRLPTLPYVGGTPLCMAPEQVRGQQVDHRADIYALGVMLYDMLTGRPPFDGETVLEVMLKHVNERPLLPSAVCIELAAIAGIDGVVMATLEKSPEQRTERASDVLNALNRTLFDNGIGATLQEVRPGIRFLQQFGSS